MRMFIPEIGELVTLIDDWKFDLYDEYRNDSVIKAIDVLSIEEKAQREKSGRYYSSRFRLDESGEVRCLGSVLIPVGTVLRVERIYIRSRLKDFDSLTFKVMTCEVNPKLKRCRFWAKLGDVRQMEVHFSDE